MLLFENHFTNYSSLHEILICKDTAGPTEDLRESPEEYNISVEATSQFSR